MLPNAVSIVTDRGRPRIWVGMLLMVSVALIVYSYGVLEKLEPDKRPTYDLLFSKGQGVKYWTAGSKSQCLAAIKGGWRVLKNGKERFSYQLDTGAAMRIDNTVQGLNPILSHRVTATFSEYRLLKKAVGSLSGVQFGFDGSEWFGSKYTTREPIMFLEGEEGSRRLHLPVQMGRELNLFFKRLAELDLRQVSAQQYRACRRRLKGD